MIILHNKVWHLKINDTPATIVNICMYYCQLVSYVGHNKLSQMVLLKKPNIYSLTVLRRVDIWNQGVSRALMLLKAQGKAPSLPPPSSRWLPLSLASLDCITPISVCVIMWPYSLYQSVSSLIIRTSIIEYKAHFHPARPILKVIPVKILFAKRIGLWGFR